MLAIIGIIFFLGTFLALVSIALDVVRWGVKRASAPRVETGYKRKCYSAKKEISVEEQKLL